MKVSCSSVIRKLRVREVNGFFSSKVSCRRRCRIYEKCPEYLQISLKKIISQQNLLLGHVIIGFSRDGKYILSYQCRITDEINFGCPCLLYKYSLHWWRFDYKRQAKKVHMVPLFSGEDISNELHLLICQPPYGDYIIVHGTTSRQSHGSSSSPCYLTIAPSPAKTKTKTKHLLHEENLQHASNSFAMHLKYESVFPHPPFMPSLNMKLGDTILLNSGDVLCAVSSYINDREHVNHCQENSKKLFQPISSIPNCLCKPLEANPSISDTNITLANGSSHRLQLQNSDFTATSLESSSCDGASSPIDRGASFSLYDGHIHQSSPNTQGDVPANRPTDGCSQANTLSSSTCPASISCYISYFSEESSTSNEGLSSPFDITSAAFPIKLTRSNGDPIKQTIRHKCLNARSSYNEHQQIDSDWNLAGKQVFFDAEQFLDNQFKCMEEIGSRYILLQDYDMQIVQACSWTNEVIILIKALIRLRGSDEDDRNCQSSSHSLDPRLSTYMTGFLLSWNVNTSAVTILKEQPIALLQKSKCKKRSHFRGLEEAVDLRKKHSIPANLNESVYSFSNHSVFSGRSMRYLLHPFQPLAIVM